jgi:5-methylcytosine-specific restriction enzyme A
MLDSYSWRRLYGTARWRKRRLFQLYQQPLCQRCKAKGFTVAAEVAHHVTPHKGDAVLFYTGELESLCKRCHDSITQNEERSGKAKTYMIDIGVDGWPIDPLHPVYTHKQPTATSPVHPVHTHNNTTTTSPTDRSTK